MEEHIYQPYDVRMAEDGEIVAIVEPDSYLKEMIEDKENCFELEIDVDYDEEENEAFLMISLHKNNGQIFMAFPYGEAWDALIEKGTITVALISPLDLENGNVSDAITLSLDLDDFDRDFIEGASKMWEAVIQE
jgi:hypothetical protein